MKLHDILKGTNDASNRALKQLFESFPKDYQLAWYPSAGNDYRDLMQLSPEKAAQSGITEVPDIFLHCDYMPEWVKLEPGIVFQDQRTTVRIVSRTAISFKLPVRYKVNPEYVDFAEKALPESLIYLLDVEIESDTLGVIRKPVIYFLFENINFLFEVLIRHSIHVSHIVKIREGCGFGGNRKSISLAYAFLSQLKTKYLVVDNEEHFDWELKRTFERRHRSSLKRFDLAKISELASWSGFQVQIFKVTHSREPLTNERIAHALNHISPRRISHGGHYNLSGRLSFPFQDSCTITITHSDGSVAEADCEKASSTIEIFQALNYRKENDFCRPMVLEFDNPNRQSYVWMNAAFERECVCVDVDNKVVAMYLQRASTGEAPFVQGFSSYKFVILAPVGFCSTYRITNESVTISIKNKSRWELNN